MQTFNFDSMGLIQMYYLLWHFQILLIGQLIDNHSRGEAEVDSLCIL